MIPADEQLHIKKYLLKGNRESFSWLFKKYERYIRLAGDQYAGPLGDSEDFVNDACVKMLTNIPKVDPKTFDFKNYFSFTIRNLYVDLYRRQSRDRKSAKLHRHETFCSPEKYEEPCIDALMEAIENLSPRLRDVVLLRLCGKQFNEIAGILKIKLNSSTGRFRHARIKLAESVDKVFPEI